LLATVCAELKSGAVSQIAHWHFTVKFAEDAVQILITAFLKSPTLIVLPTQVAH